MPESFLIELQAWPATLLQKKLWHRCFPANFAKLLRTPFFITEPQRWLLLRIWLDMILKVREKFGFLIFKTQMFSEENRKTRMQWFWILCTQKRKLRCDKKYFSFASKISVTSDDGVKYFDNKKCYQSILHHHLMLRISLKQSRNK